VNIGELVAKDIKRNNKSITIEDAKKSLALHRKNGAKFYRFGNTLVVQGGRGRIARGKRNRPRIIGLAVHQVVDHLGNLPWVSTLVR